MIGDNAPPSRQNPLHEKNESEVGTNLDDARMIPDEAGTNPDGGGTNPDGGGTNLDDAGTYPDDTETNVGGARTNPESGPTDTRVESKIRSPSTEVATGQRDNDAPSMGVATVGKKTGQMDLDEVGGQIWTSVGISVLAGETTRKEFKGRKKRIQGQKRKEFKGRNEKNSRAEKKIIHGCR